MWSLIVILWKSISEVLTVWPVDENIWRTDPPTDAAVSKQIVLAPLSPPHFHLHSRFGDSSVTGNIVGIDGSFQIQQYLCGSRQKQSGKTPQSADDSSSRDDRELEIFIFFTLLKVRTFDFSDGGYIHL